MPILGSSFGISASVEGSGWLAIPGTTIPVPAVQGVDW